MMGDSIGFDARRNIQNDELQKFQVKLTSGKTKVSSAPTGMASPKSAESRSPKNRGPTEISPTPPGNR